LILEAPFPLQVLNIANTKLGLKGAQAIADHLARNKTIRELIVEENELGSKGVEVIVKAIKVYSSVDTWQDV
jgi:Ran GTPase-activating protein (RanGAP) involved in mRNA processing and transport